VVVNGRAMSPLRCACGSELVAAGLPGGIYEIRRSQRTPRRRPRAPLTRPLLPHEPDLGYGESHGYGPAHGGPTGPGDAPAEEGLDEAGGSLSPALQESAKVREDPT
jgi:hypothetical protein